MNQFVEQVYDLYRASSALMGPFVLFGLFMREDGIGLWDLVVSAAWWRDWGDDESRRLRAEFFEELKTRLGSDAVLLSQVVLLAPREDFVRALEGIRFKDGAFSVTGSPTVFGRMTAADRWVEMQDVTFNGMDFRHVILFEYDPEAAEEPGRVAVGA